MKESLFNDELMEFLKKAVTPFHAVTFLVEILKKNGFAELSEKDSWNLVRGGKYYVTRNGSSLIAFVTGEDELTDSGIRMAGSHTDSPCLKVKPTPEIVKNGYLQLGVEVYGGALLNPWFDRDLSLAGRIGYIDGQGQLKSTIIDFRKKVAVIPSLAIHLDREANKSRSINPQTDIPPLILQFEDDEEKDFRDILKDEIVAQEVEDDVEEVLDYEMSFYDANTPSYSGLRDEFISSARLDNLLSCFAGIKGLTEASSKVSSLFVCNDHEEVGSLTTAGAQGPFLKSVLERFATGEELTRVINRSMMISADNAHGIHPNFNDKYDGNHGPLMNKGPVIKINSNQSYATNSETGSIFRSICRDENIPVQSFVVRTDMGCGSTIGPITAAGTGVRTIDVGVPMLGMHSIRELVGSKDGFWLYKALCRFFKLKEIPDLQ